MFSNVFFLKIFYKNHLNECNTEGSYHVSEKNILRLNCYITKRLIRILKILKDSMKKGFLSSILQCYFFNKVNRKFVARKFVLIICILILFFPFKSDATHIGGADLSYKWINGDNFEFTLTLYRDCSGIAAPNSVSVNYKSTSCGYNLNVMLNKVPGTGTEITKPCTSSLTNCNGGTTAGIQKYEYTGIVTLPARCNDWIIGYSICCRNCAITTLSYTPNNCSGVPATYIEATLNNLATPDNSSPVFTNVPVSFFCIGQEFHYNHGAYDPDGDSLAYSFIDPRSAPATNVVFNAGYSATNPISSTPPISIGTNGDIIMNPTAQEVGVMTILVQEYRNGILIGSVVRDMEVWTSPCTNILPIATGINGSSVFNLAACPGNPVSFNINCADADASQNVSMSWNNSIPGGIFTSSGGTRPVGTFTWNPAISDVRSQPYTFTVTVQDDNCPLNGFQTYSYKITVHDISVLANSTNSICSSPGSGTATAIPTGDGPFQYLWSPGGQTTSSINGLTPGSYTATITNSYGCTASATTNITTASFLNVTLVSKTNPTCFSSNNGSISVNAFNGASPYNYSWSPSGGTTSIASGLTAGNYTVTVTDAGGCSVSMSTTLTSPANIIPVATGSNLKCNGDASGFASVSASGGVGSYSYVWSTGATTSSINNLNAGNYSVIVSDAISCTNSVSVILTEPPVLSGTVASSTSVSCYGGNNGTGAISATGGSSPYSYSWFPSGNTLPGAAGLTAGNYIVTITDSNNCTAAIQIVITEPALLTTSISSFGNPLCTGDTSGFANVSESGGTSPFSYLWLPNGKTTSSISGLAAGNYSVTVTDINGCTSASSITLSQPTPLSINQQSITNVSCYGGSDGSSSFSSSGGTSPYTFQWSPSGGNNSTANNLSQGNYTVKTTDANGCSVSQSITINEPTAITAIINSTGTTCFNGTDGSANVVSSGGTGPYYYLWSPGNNTSATVNGLSAQNYSVIISDSMGCSFTTGVTISQPPGMTLTITTTDASCGKSNGSASVFVTGGAVGYSYFWTPVNSNNDTISNIPAGAYTITVVDSTGCTASDIAIVSNIGAPDITLASLTPVSCNGGNDGAASVNISGGIGPFKYLWNPSGGTGSSASGLTAGSYTVQVTGKNKCFSLISIDIPEPNKIQVNATSLSVSCYGANDGSIKVTVTGGTGTYNYVWNNVIGNSPSGNGLPPGNYFVIITDQNGCSDSSNSLVTEPPILSAIINNQTNVTCFGGNNGSATITVNGGTPPYTYNWNIPGETASTISNLTAGNYTVTVTDATWCTTTTGVIINQPAELVVLTSSTPGSCNLPNGIASVNISGGTSPFSYLWSQTGDTISSISGLSSGNYTVNVIDNNGCQKSAAVSVSNTGMFSANISSIKDVSCNNGNDGSAIVNVINGTQPYSYNWQPKGGSFPLSSGLNAGNYTVTVTDASNCTMNLSATVSEPPSLSAVVSTTHVKCSGQKNGTAKVSATGGTGVFTYQWLPGGMNTPSIGSLDGGNYSVNVMDGNNCIISKQFIINEPPPIILNTSTTKAGCTLSNGSASVNVSGGTMPFTYLWSPGGSQSSSINGIAAGSYLITVTDSNSCSSTVTASVSNTTGPAASLLTSTPANCYKEKSGKAEIKINGGVSPYSISWFPTGGSSLISDSLLAGSYSVSVRDANNCLTTIPVTISEPPQLKSSITPTLPLCNGGSDGSAIAIINGGIAPYTYSWSTGDSTSLARGLSKGTYSLNVQDAHGCITSFSTIINEPTPTKLQLYIAPVSCFGRKDGFAAVLASGGTPGYSYLWSNGYTYNSGTNFFAGNYTITVTDAHGCAKDSSVNIKEPTQVILSVTATNESCRDLNDGQATVNASGGIPPYTFLWWPVGGNNPTATNLPRGDYDIIVEDQNGCRQKINANIGSPPPIRLSTINTNVKCYGGNNATAQATISGGTPPYSYFWSSGSTSNVASSLQAGSYTVVITDNNSCTSEATIIVNEPPAIIPTVQISGPICIGQSATLTAACTGGTPGYTYTWNNGSHNVQQIVTPASTSNYSVTVTDTLGCSSSPTIATVTVNPGLLALSSGPDTICEGTFATLLAFCSGGNGGPYTYTWDNGATGNLITIAPSVTGNYTVTVADNCGSPPISTIVTVVVIPNPVVNFIPNLFMGCQPLEVFFNDQSDPDATEFYWNFGDGSSDTSKNPSHIYLDAGSFTVNHLVKTDRGCLGKIVIPSAIIVYPVPVANFSNVPESASIHNPTIAFIDGSTNTAKWEWDFGDNSGTVLSKNTEHTYRDTGTYIVRLITTSDKGCIDTVYKRVIVKEEFAFYIPNAFTPNNDGVNDHFVTLGLGIKKFEMNIYDRWGLKIFYSSDIKKGWDGKVQDNETPCQMDVYVYKIDILDLQGVEHNYVGRISLVR